MIIMHSKKERMESVIEHMKCSLKYELIMLNVAAKQFKIAYNLLFHYFLNSVCHNIAF